MYSTTGFFSQVGATSRKLTSAPNSGFTMLYGCVAATKGFESTPIIPIIIGVEMPKISHSYNISLFHYIYPIGSMYGIFTYIGIILHYIQGSM